MNDTRITRKVSALLARANHPTTPSPEADTARAKAALLARTHGLRDPEPPPVAHKPKIVHWMSGFTTSGHKSRAWCRCGHGTTPRVDENRALHALVTSHPLDTAECVLCGVTYTDWRDFRDFLQVFEDPMNGNQSPMCRDPTVCLARGPRR